MTLPDNRLYSWIYAPGTYQNKPHRPGRYVFWLTQALDTTTLADGGYTLEVGASDMRRNTGMASMSLTIANGSTVSAQLPPAAEEVALARHAGVPQA